MHTRRSFLRSSTAVTASSLLTAAGLSLPVITSATDGNNPVSSGQASGIFWHDSSTDLAAGAKHAVLKKRKKAQGSKPAGAWETEGPAGNSPLLHCPVINGQRIPVSWEVQISVPAEEGYEYDIFFE